MAIAKFFKRNNLYTNKLYKFEPKDVQRCRTKQNADSTDKTDNSRDNKNSVGTVVAEVLQRSRRKTLRVGRVLARGATTSFASGKLVSFKLQA